jgi:hypothetical protein
MVRKGDSRRAKKRCAERISGFDIAWPLAITAAIRPMIRLVILPVFLFSLASGGRAAEGTRFTGSQSCASSGCHGGGVGKDQTRTFLKDVHLRVHAILSSGRSTVIAERLGLKDAAKSARCTVCHSPLQSVSPALFVEGAKVDLGVSCESCHGPAERWLRSHTRPDYTREMRLAVGMRDLSDYYARANNCIACHQNVDSALLDASHPEIFFELDSQMAAEPPHWSDQGAWLGPRAWLTGQAAALREISWALTKKPGDPALQSRWQALAWLLRKTESGASALPEGGAAGEMQSAADRLARTASKEQWSKESTLSLFRKFARLGNDFRAAGNPEINPLRRRGEVIAIAMNRLWAALKREGSVTSPNLDISIATLAQLGRAQAGFEPVKFAAALEQVEVNLELLGKP